MAKILDRILMFIYSLSIAILSVFVILVLTDAVPLELKVLEQQPIYIGTWVAAILLLLISIRVFYISVSRDRSSATSIDQRNEYGDIQISVDTIENLAYKAASRVRGIKEVKTRIRITESGLEIVVRALVDGETSIPALTEEVQKQVHDRVEEITGIPVSYVSVYIANLVHSPVLKGRVE
ncbi:alkaline shock response membrane anchor protein AmaP [Paenibacillus phoenicis]|uniref:Alkaline shock response membrane anchor protein AmaP n=1 Tax=Paenibacillus phoenicis TaxID=554117 RepID=A0ABU5PJF3_9BACL|nr:MULTISPECIES: alkaline shock response membrane anchor protein AmaP [Paenibacillus]EES72226.1 hypothetical protein POTG_03066 [Paenibacillus sp. oral taxon 786 str. D14]MCT2195176.1 alkaline shock response membrane anchor protein AmaP [Paenibacillus sp. p3-SID1389]MEA3569995.1 alkaline shock response membrane anchor protein AmaP [Paenibacillus phoenicis]